MLISAASADRASRYNMSDEQRAAYSAFVRMLASLEKNVMLDLTADALKDAQETKLLRDFNGLI